MIRLDFHLNLHHLLGKKYLLVPEDVQPPSPAGPWLYLMSLFGAARAAYGAFYQPAS